MIHQIRGLRSLLLRYWLHDLLLFVIIIGADFEVIEEFAERENEVFVHLESIVVHILRNNKNGWASTGFT